MKSQNLTSAGHLIHTYNLNDGDAIVDELMETGKVLKLESADSGIVFYRITSTGESSHTIKPLCKIRKGFLTVEYRNVRDS
jgi:hypothetical protein